MRRRENVSWSDLCRAQIPILWMWNVQAVIRSQQFSAMHRQWCYVLDVPLCCVSQLVEKLVWLKVVRSEENNTKERHVADGLNCVRDSFLNGGQRCIQIKTLHKFLNCSVVYCTKRYCGVWRWQPSLHNTYLRCKHIFNAQEDALIPWWYWLRIQCEKRSHKILRVFVCQYVYQELKSYILYMIRCVRTPMLWPRQ